VRGQVDAVVCMVEEDLCCLDVARQLLAASALLRKAKPLFQNWKKR